ncbi:protein-glutamine gamma-glutamyltransferase TgpA [soil metagenome]
MMRAPPNMSAIASLHASWKKLPLSRDKADTLLLLFACLLVLLPHTLVLAWWVSTSCLGLMLWRGWLTLTGRRLPPSWILLPISALLMSGVYATYHTFLGREAGVTMLALLLACKLLEMHAKRDLFVVIFLSFFLLLTSFFYSQTIATAAMSLLAVATLLTAQLSFQYTSVVPSLWHRAKLGLTILGLAIPLTVVSFFLFPRIQGPLWSLPGDANSGSSGLSDSMSPGNISKLALSDDIAFRVKLSEAMPPRSKLYWRGIVLTHFDGRAWSHRDAPRFSPASGTVTTNGLAIHQQIILEPSGQAWLFALDIPGNEPSLEAGDNNGAPAISSLNSQLEIVSSQTIHKRVRYHAVSYPEYRLQADAPASVLRRSLELPIGFNPQTLRYAAALRQRAGTVEQATEQILQMFRRENFIYTLEPPLLGINSIDEFLFSSRAGFCEHYASAFVVLMRAMGIPARVVTGYQGGAINSVDGYIEVRQSDAHAWSEIWLAGRGWIRIDPTAAVAPERVMHNLQSTQAPSGMAGLVNLTLDNNSWLQHLRMQWSAVNNSWNLWVLNYSQAKQIDVLRALGLAQFDWTQLSLIFFLLAAVAMALVALPLMLHRPQISALDRIYLSLCQKLAKQGFPKASHEGPYAFGQRLQSSLPKAQYEAIQAFLSLYARTKYGKKVHPEADVLAQLKTLLAQCRQH